MIDQTEMVLVRAPEISQVSAGDPFFEHAQEITGLITRRAYELFASSGFTHGHDREDSRQVALRKAGACCRGRDLEHAQRDSQGNGGRCLRGNALRFR